MKKLFTCIFSAALYLGANAQSPIDYTISFPNLVHHEAEISFSVNRLAPGPLRLHMSRSSPGRYATHEFAKNVYNVKAFDATGKVLAITKVNPDVWEVAIHGATATIKYTLFGNWTDGTYVSFDESHAHMNMPGTLLWIEGMDKRPITIKFADLKKHNWKVATQLKPMGNDTYYARDLQYVMDSPTELSDYKDTAWQVVETDGKKQTIRVATHSIDAQPVIDNFGKMVQRLVLEEKAVFGELPAYDYGNYVFLQEVYPTIGGDGMEHRNSTVISQPAPKVEGLEKRLLSTFSHEYFHSWNVERIRPKSLEPFNFEHANMSEGLWFAEGFTQYYGDLLLARAGFNTADDFYNDAAGLVNQVLNTPGAKNYSAVENSKYAVFADAGVANDATNKGNMFTSYYTYGGAIALALDLRLRTEFNLTLDDYMRAVWLAHGKPEKPYTIPDLQTALTTLTGNSAFAADFYRKYVYGIEKNDYAALLDKAGLVLKQARPGKAWAGRIGGFGGRSREGAVGGNNSGGLALSAGTVIGTPLYKAGLDAGDIINSIDGVAITDAKGFTDAVNAKNPGDRVEITCTNRAGAHKTTLVLEEDPSYSLTTYEKTGKTPSEKQLALRNAWLSTKVK